MDMEQCMLQEQIPVIQFQTPRMFDIFGAALCNMSVEDFQLLRHLLYFFTENVISNNNNRSCIRTYPYPVSPMIYNELQSRLTSENNKISLTYENGMITARYTIDSL